MTSIATSFPSIYCCSFLELGKKCGQNKKKAVNLMFKHVPRRRRQPQFPPSPSSPAPTPSSKSLSYVIVTSQHNSRYNSWKIVHYFSFYGTCHIISVILFVSHGQCHIANDILSVSHSQCHTVCHIVSVAMS